VKIYLDTGDGLFSSSSDTYLGRESVTGLSGGSATVTLSSAQTVGITASNYFVAYDIASGASPLRGIGAQLDNTSYVTVANPATVVFAATPLETTSETALPVELTAFTASPDALGVRVEWGTQSEVGNAAWRLLRLGLEAPEDTTALAKATRSHGTAARGPGLASATDVAFVRGQGNKATATQYSYHDASGAPGVTYAYYLVDVDYYGQESVHGPIFATPGVPSVFRVRQNYPNPFNPSTVIGIDLPEKRHVRLVVYNTVGQVVAILQDGEMAAGYHSVDWNGLDDGGRAAGSGTYVYMLRAVDQSKNDALVRTRTMTLVK